MCMEHGAPPPDPCPTRSGPSRRTRRAFLVDAASAAGLTAAGALSLGEGGCASVHGTAPGFIDTHTHFYDPARPQGIPWPPKDDPVLYRPVYPEEFARLARPHRVTGTVVVEASPWSDDNQWLLDLAARESTILGVVGRLQPGQPGFAADLRRFAANPLYRGIRIGAWERERSGLASQPALVRDLHLLADQDLSLDLLIGPDQLPQAAQLAVAVPRLRIIINHCANVRVDGAPPPARWLDGLSDCARFPNLFMKVSGLVEGTGRSNRDAPSLPALYRPTLEAVWSRFGRDRLLFGSNWPVSSRFASYATVFQVVHQYFVTHGADAVACYFQKNARRVYRLSRSPPTPS